MISNIVILNKKINMKKKQVRKEWIPFEEIGGIVHHIWESSTFWLKIGAFFDESGNLHPDLLNHFSIESGSEDEKEIVEQFKTMRDASAKLFANGIGLFPAV